MAKQKVSDKGFEFGLDEAPVVAELQRILDLHRAGKVIIQGFTNTIKTSASDYETRSVTIDYVQGTPDGQESGNPTSTVDQEEAEG